MASLGPSIALLACSLTTDFGGLTSGGPPSSSSGTTSGAPDTGSDVVRLPEAGTPDGTGSDAPAACTERTATKNAMVATGEGGGAPFSVWNNPEGALVANDNSVASATASVFVSPPPLVVKKLGFAIPDGAAVRGITVTIRRSGDGIHDEGLRLVIRGIPNGDDKKAAAAWTTAFTSVSYGGPADRWGLSPTPKDVDADDFGVSLVVGYRDSGNSEADVDEIAVTVSYCE